MLETHEVLGTNLPIFREKQLSHFSYEEVCHLDFDMFCVKQVGYAWDSVFGKALLKPVYEIK